MKPHECFLEELQLYYIVRKHLLVIQKKLVQ